MGFSQPTKKPNELILVYRPAEVAGSSSFLYIVVLVQSLHLLGQPSAGFQADAFAGW